MGMADPWGPISSDSDGQKGPDSFEDDFAKKDYVKLPDSSEYLSVLERKLARIQKKSAPPTTATTKDLVRGLSAVRADHMRHFLSPESSVVVPNRTSEEPIPMEPEPFLNDPLYTSWMMQRLRPDRQALSAEELAQLLRFDTLALYHEQLVGAVENEADEVSTGNSDGSSLAEDKSASL